MAIAKKPPELVQHIIDMLDDSSGITSSRFFGGWGLRVRGEQFAMVMKSTLYFRVDDQLRKELVAEGGVPFSYTKGNKRIRVERFISAPAECLEDADELGLWATKAMKLV